MSDLTLVIGNKNYSSWSLRPWFYLKFFNIPFKEIRIPLYEDKYKEKILEYSPSGKVPCLVDGEINVWDSLSIMEYLAEKLPEKNGWPNDPQVKAIARSVASEMHSGFFALREYLPMNCRKVIKNFVPPDNAVIDIYRVKNIWKDCRENYGKSGPWLFGDFSIADCMYAPVVMRFITYGVALSPLEEDYVNAVRNHPVMVEWISAAKEETEIIEAEEVD